MFSYIYNESKENSIRRENKLITVGGMIGSGKTTVTKLLAKELGFAPYYENVEGNDILPLFYTASAEEKRIKRYPFLLQLEFLNSRFESIKDGLTNENDVVMDRSIYEDWYFARVNTDIGDISKQEFVIYEKLLNNMMQELEELPKKKPDLMVYLSISFEETLNRIGIRGREFEQDKGLYDYYYQLWSGYDEWVQDFYKKSDILVLNMDKLDIINNSKHRELLVSEVRKVYNKKI